VTTVLSNSDKRRVYDTTNTIYEPIASDSVDLTDANFDALVLDSDYLWFIQVWAEWAPGVESLSKAWEKQVRKFQGEQSSPLIRLGRIHATLQVCMRTARACECVCVCVSERERKRERERERERERAKNNRQQEMRHPPRRVASTRCVAMYALCECGLIAGTTASPPACAHSSPSHPHSFVFFACPGTALATMDRYILG
jgi:hypothetical protein